MFLENLKSNPAAEITAICSRTKDRVQELAGKFHIPNMYTDYQELIRHQDLDAIVIATPDDLHYEMTMAALDYDHHILCEKPMAMNVQDAMEMYQKAEPKGIKHMVLFTWRWQPHFRYLKQLVDEGAIGRVTHAHFYFLGDFGLAPEYRWRADGKRSNGAVSDRGAHLIDFARYYVGDIVKVNAHLATHVEIPGRDDKSIVPANDSASVQLQFKNGAQGVLMASSVAHRGDREIEMGVRLYGDNGTLEAEQVFSGPEAGAMLNGVLRGKELFQEIDISQSFYGRLEKDDLFGIYSKLSVGPRLFVDAIHADQPMEPNFYDGLIVQEVIDAAIQSDRTQSWVDIEQ
jgi:predicted dehydrogenase